MFNNFPFSQGWYSSIINNDNNMPGTFLAIFLIISLLKFFHKTPIFSFSEFFDMVNCLSQTPEECTLERLQWKYIAQLIHLKILSSNQISEWSGR